MFRLGASQLGPGPGEWLVEDPRVHGLSSAKLASAAERHARELDQRDCLLVVKDGVIVHETYREGGDADTLHYLDGVGRRRRRCSSAPPSIRACSTSTRP